MSDDLELQRALRIVRASVQPGRVLVICAPDMRITQRLRHATGTVQFTVRPTRHSAARRRDEVLAEWDMCRDHVRYQDFHTKVGMTAQAWQKAFQRARRDGDPRAWRHSDKQRKAS